MSKESQSDSGGVSCSLPGMPETEDKVTGMPGTDDKVALPEVGKRLSISSTSMASSNSLSSCMDQGPVLADGSSLDILYAIRAGVALSGFGKTFRREDCDVSKHRMRTDHIDEFWSYSRHARQVNVVCMLLLHHCGLQATLAGFAASMASTLLLHSPSLIGATKTVSRGQIGLVALLSGNLAAAMIMRRSRSQRRVFLDKACISQDNEEEKRMGILSLGYFLKKSNDMVVLWDRTYFTRIWCVFEIAAYLRLKAGETQAPSLKVLPVVYGPLTAVWFLVVTVRSAMHSLGVFSHHVDPNANLLEVTQRVAMALFLIFLILYVLVGKRIGRQIADFAHQREQLQQFCCSQANCYCCAVGHKLPDSSKSIACDRVLIEGSVTSWFGDVGTFDDFVRTEVCKHVCLRFCLPYRYAIFGALPILWTVPCQFLWDVRHGDHAMAWVRLIDSTMLAVFVAPIICHSIWGSFSLFFGVARQQKLGDNVAALCSVMVACFASFCSVLLYGSLPVLLGMPFGFVAKSVLFGTYTLVVYRDNF